VNTIAIFRIAGHFRHATQIHLSTWVGERA
jgi:hypothetical protein